MENYSVWLCDQHTWKYFTVSHTTVDDSKMPAIHHQGIKSIYIFRVTTLGDYPCGSFVDLVRRDGQARGSYHRVAFPCFDWI